MFDRILNTTLPSNLIIACRRPEEKLSKMGLNKGILPPNFLDYNNTKHKSKKMKS